MPNRLQCQGGNKERIIQHLLILYLSWCLNASTTPTLPSKGKSHKPQINCLIIIVKCLKRKKEVPHMLCSLGLNFKASQSTSWHRILMETLTTGSTRSEISSQLLHNFPSIVLCCVNCRSQSLCFLRCTLKLSCSHLQMLCIMMMATRRCTLWMLTSIFKRQPHYIYITLLNNVDL